MPRRLCANPKQFGQTEIELVPAPDVAPDGDQFRAAMLQHLVVNRVRGELLRTGRSLVDYGPPADADGSPRRADRLERVFRGETMLSLTDLVRWSFEFPAVAELVAQYLGSSIPAGLEPEVVAAIREPTREEMVAAYRDWMTEREAAAKREADADIVKRAGLARTPLPYASR